MPAPKPEGFKKGENVVTLFTGWGVLSAKNWYANVWGNEMNYPQIIKDIYKTQDGSLFGTCAVLSPPIADFVKGDGLRYRRKIHKMGHGSTGQRQKGMACMSPRRAVHLRL